MKKTYNCPKYGIHRGVIVCGILLLILFSNVVSAAHTFDNSATVGTTSFPTSPNPRTVSYTAGNGATLMVVSIFVHSGEDTRAGGAPTFNGKTMTAAYNTVPGNSNYEAYPEIWYLLLTSDDTGSEYTISVPNTGSNRIQFQVATYKSATGLSALDGSPAADIQTSGANPSASITTTANGDVIVSAIGDGYGNNAPTAVNAGSILYANDADSYSASTGYYLQVSAGTQAITWTVSSSNHVLVVAAFREVAPPTYIPPSPTGLSSTQGNFWINYTWSAGSGNLTNSYNVSVNGTWTNGSWNTFKNTSAGPHGWSNISVYAYNSSGAGRLSATPVSQNTQIANNLVTIGNVSGSYTITAGNNLTIYPTSSDLDGDTPVFTRNFTNGTFYTNNGTLHWTTTGSDTGIHSWQINVIDGFGSIYTENFTVIVTAAPTYSLNTTYTFNETNPNSTWQSISIKDNSYGDPLTNVSILNFTSGMWESILKSATPFTGGITPVEHVNVIKGASGNASSYDAGGGQIKIRYNWTNSALNNNLGVDMINVTVMYKSTFLLNITTNTTLGQGNYSNYELEINYSCDVNETGYDVYVYNGSVWNLKKSLTSTNWTLANFTLNSSEVINGNISVRYLDQTPAGTSQGNLYIDYQRTRYSQDISGSYRLNVTTNTSDIPQATNHTLQLRYNVSGDNFTLQIWNGSSWNNKTTLNNISLSNYSIILQSNELISDGYNNYHTLVRYLDLNASATQQGTLYIDYQRIYNV